MTWIRHWDFNQSQRPESIPLPNCERLYFIARWKRLERCVEITLECCLYSSNLSAAKDYQIQSGNWKYLPNKACFHTHNKKGDKSTICSANNRLKINSFMLIFRILYPLLGCFMSQPFHTTSDSKKFTTWRSWCNWSAVKDWLVGPPAIQPEHPSSIAPTSLFPWLFKTTKSGGLLACKKNCPAFMTKVCADVCWFCWSHELWIIGLDCCVQVFLGCITASKVIAFVVLQREIQQEASDPFLSLPSSKKSSNRNWNRTNLQLDLTSRSFWTHSGLPVRFTCEVNPTWINSSKVHQKNS